MFKESKALYKKAKIFPFIPTGEYYFNKGIKAYDRFDINKAKKYLKRALELEPHEPMIACQLALVHTEAAEYAESNKLLYEVLNELDDRMTECHYFLANNFAYLGLFTDAYKHARLYLDLDQTGEFQEDAEELLELIGLEDDENIDDLTEQEEIINQQDTARKLLESGDFANAIEMLEKAVEDHPEFWPAHNNLALAYFYEGKTEKAAGVLENVLEKNPGNLHALCNLAVFLYYERQTEQLETLLTALDKVQPLLFEQRYKLGATFALTGKYDQAYFWLRQIQKYGFDGDAGYYYWLAKSAYFTGNEKVAHQAWKQLSKINPEKAVVEPWSEKEQPDPRNGEDDVAIMKMLRSDRLEERLYGIFLISVSGRQQELITHSEFKPLDDFSLTEKIYLAHILHSGKKEKIDPDGFVEKGHEIALLLFNRYKAHGMPTRPLLITWFSIFLKALKSGTAFTNKSAIAAAAEYIWLRQSNNKKTQKILAEEYGISQSTLRKYIRLLELHSD
ncbi:tetratricopeptide repeat protein [Lederbergia citrea]|uniref:Tetratricopeptide repeat protein n=1 Tax=Lederbergia citrea TaxID=2833581 RepID=A0A942UKC2_9BACI|nr:tetratricopeptide repeat protein [Lederbergia citrea]MBS4223056.1 tetratricopeptide repeat protein [Lederbergia citrea]